MIKKLSRASSSESLRSNNSSTSASYNSIYSYTSSFSENIINSQETNVVQIHCRLHNWSIPHMKINTIYQQDKFELLQNYAIKTEEQTISLN